jgi:hypothetical protein
MAGIGSQARKGAFELVDHLADEDQSVGGRIGKRPNHDVIGDRIDEGSGADAEAQREDARGRERGRVTQAPDRVSEVIHPKASAFGHQ